MRLEPNQIEKLGRLFAEWWIDQVLPIPLETEAEPAYTGHHLLPRVEKFVNSLQRPFLMTRGDGGLPPLPLSVDDLAFYPDVEVAAQQERYLAVETKYVRGADATGALAKAIGQGFLYRALGVSSAHVVLLDLRPGQRLQMTKQSRELRQHAGNLGVHVHWFVPQAGQLIHRSM